MSFGRERFTLISRGFLRMSVSIYQFPVTLFLQPLLITTVIYELINILASYGSHHKPHLEEKMKSQH